MSANVCNNKKIKQSRTLYRLQLNEFIYTALEKFFIAFARFNIERKRKEDFLFCNNLPITTSTVYVKAIADLFLTLEVP